MFRKFCICLALVSAVATTQLPLGFVQMCAWIGMFSDHMVETGSVKTSLDRTFDGQHPCGVCDFVSDQLGDGGKSELSLFDPSYIKVKLAHFVVEKPVIQNPPLIGEISPAVPLLHSEAVYVLTPPPRVS
mgnify:FL=1